MCWPEFRTLLNEFSTIVSKLSKVLGTLTPAQFDSLLVYLRERLKPMVNGCFPTGEPADLPKGTITPLTLMQHLQDRWDYLNTDLIEDVTQHVCKGILQCVSPSANALQTPPNYTTMAVEINHKGTPLSFHLHQILKLKDVLVHTFGVRGTLFAGWGEGSIVLYFFIPEEAVYSLCPKLESGCVTLQHLCVTTVVVFGHFSVDIGCQQMSLLRKVCV